MNTAVLCKKCGNRTTRNPSSLCARCRKKADIPMRLCECCESRRTRDKSGLCYQCRSKKVSHNYDISRIDAAISKCETTLQILKLKAQGNSFRSIATELNLPKSSVANAFFAAVFSGSRGNSFDVLDGDNGMDIQSVR